MLLIDSPFSCLSLPGRPSRLDLSRLRLEEVLNVVQLYQALGGGWRRQASRMRSSNGFSSSSCRPPLSRKRWYAISASEVSVNAVWIVFS